MSNNLGIYQCWFCKLDISHLTSKGGSTSFWPQCLRSAPKGIIGMAGSSTRLVFFFMIVFGFGFGEEWADPLPLLKSMKKWMSFSLDKISRDAEVSWCSMDGWWRLMSLSPNLTPHKHSGPLSLKFWVVPFRFLWWNLHFLWLYLSCP